VKDFVMERSPKSGASRLYI